MQLVGRSSDGTPASGHRHAFIGPADLDGDGALDHVLVWAREPLQPELVETLQTLSWVQLPNGRKLEVAPADPSVADRWLGPATTWASVTPFVLPRHSKLRSGKPRRDSRGRWVEGPEWQLRRLLAELGFPDPLPMGSDEVLHGAWTSGRCVPWHQFQRTRSRGGGRRGTDQGFGFRVRFPAPVLGPIAVGYGAHFGLGQFHPE